MSPPALAEPSRAAWLPRELRSLWSPGLLPSKLPGLSYSCMSPTRLSLSLSQRELASSPKAVPPRLSCLTSARNPGCYSLLHPERSYLSCLLNLLNHPRSLPFSLPPETTPPAQVTSSPPHTSLLPRLAQELLGGPVAWGQWWTALPARLVPAWPLGPVCWQHPPWGPTASAQAGSQYPVVLGWWARLCPYPRSGPRITPFSASALSSSLPDDLLLCPLRPWRWSRSLLSPLP